MKTAQPSRRSGLTLAAILTLVAGSAPSALADEVMLQWFENSWEHIELRMPDFFLAGYDATWLPPIMVASDPSSPGYDQFDKFNIGTPNNPTIYGTEAGFRHVVEQFHRAGANVYVDTILNHASGRSGDEGFMGAGGYPGFWMNPPASGHKSTGGDWGDFHNGSTQATDPNGANYDVWTGDLVGLIDIDQGSTNFFIRHPVEEGNPDNIPAGDFRNRPDANNYRFYPDLDLEPKVFTEPFSGRQWEIYPFNTESPLEGDPVVENATGLLMRHCQWLLDDIGIDGFRLDAIKHVPQWFWNEFFDAAVFDRRRNPDGTTGTAFSFGEAVTDSGTMLSYVRKDGFGNRDTLDLNGAGALRDLVNQRGFGNWQNVLNAHIDSADDGFNNGSVGVNHVYSHDNGSNGDGGNAPGLPFDDKAAWHAFAYVLLRPGPSIVYYNSREMHDRYAFRGFWPREGNPEALGVDKDGTSPNPRITDLVKISNMYGRGQFDVLSLDNDVMVFQRSGNGSATVLVGVNDSFATGFDTRNVLTGFTPGTILQELTGNASDPAVDPNGVIFDQVTVGANGLVTIRVPRNKTGSFEHNRGYVVYGPAAPSGELSVNPIAMTLPASSASDPVYRRRLTTVPVVQADQFLVTLTTTQTDPNDPNTDDNALLRVGRGFVDLNDNGSWDITSGEFRGWEEFTTTNQPLIDHPGAGQGLYRQIVDTTVLPEGYNYLNAVAFRSRSAGDPIVGDFREVIYVDRADPDLSVATVGVDCQSGSGTLRFTNGDGTLTDMWVFVNLPDGAPIPPLTTGAKAFDFDRGVFIYPFSGEPSGANRVTVVMQEKPMGMLVRQSVATLDFSIGGLTGDLNEDGVIDSEDLYAFDALDGYLCAADLDGNGVIDQGDEQLLADLVRDGEIADIDSRD
ncbi:MAG: alpha-amylase family glycosyl hydrolase [Phycisphaerales bacterium JB065]